MNNGKFVLQNISVSHNAIADWLIANPGRGQMGKCAAVFGITNAWLSVLIHQDAFKSMLKVKQNASFDLVIIPLQDKIAGVAHRSVEKMGEILDTTNDHRLVREIGKDMLTAMGYGGNAKAAVVIDNSTTNNLTVDAGALADARQRQSEHYGRILESPSNASAETDEAETPELSHSPEPEVGASSDVRASGVDSTEAVHGSAKEGSEV